MNTQKQRGFTLLELAIYMGLLSMLLMTMSQIFVATLKVKVESQSNSTLFQESNYILSRMTYDIHRSSRIVSPAWGASSMTGFTLGIVEGGSERLYQYTLSGETLSISDGITTDTLHSDSVYPTQFTVLRLGNSGLQADAKDTLQIVLTLTSRYLQTAGQDSITTQSTVGLR